MCDDEFVRYEKHRSDLTKAELEAEKNFDTVLASLASLAIGSSFTVLKDITKGAGATLIITAWVALGICVFSSLLDRLLTYLTHQKWRLKFDNEFETWSEGAWQRGLDAYDKLPLINALPWLKWVSLSTLFIGVILLLAAVLYGWNVTSVVSAPASATATSPLPPITVNVYALQPTTRP